uniref:non-specific serine/threonine protein kinase n=1 Tax=Ananas comosus var. bracteatus TaxID=296719 RepID=A0A6V7NYY6_ANACO|nr:unnamed protein product [Ananas comosus var. bracteatus]
MKHHFFLSLLSLSILSLPPSSSSSSSSPAPQSSTIYIGASFSIEGNEGEPLLTSPDSAFAAGFYAIGANAYCFAIWFAGSAEKTAVWAANRDFPVNGRGSRLTFGHDGHLVLTDVDGSVVWDSSAAAAAIETGTATAIGGAATSSAAAEAELLDMGNLVLRDGSGRTVWQSFDYPTDTLLPTQALTKGKRLVSRFGPGAFRAGYHSLYFDNDNVLRLMYDGPDISSIYWPSPDYNVFQNGRTDYNSTRLAVLDRTGRFSSSDGLGVSAADSGPVTKRRRITLDYDGNLRIYSLNETGVTGPSRGPRSPSAAMSTGSAGPTGSAPAGGAAAAVSLRRAPADRLLRVRPRVQLVHLVRRLQADLRAELLVPRLRIPAHGTGVCYPKIALFNGYTSPNFPGNFYLKVPRTVEASESTIRSVLRCGNASAEVEVGSASMYGKNRNSTKWAYLYVFALALGALELLFVVTGWWFLFRKHDTSKSVQEGYKMISSQFRRFTYRELKEATGKFKEELGRGGAGAVYRGVLEDKRVVAVKKLTDVSQGEEEFWAEVSVIGRINHMNLVRLWGFCSEGRHRLLVYEFIDNESLDKYLFGSSSSSGSGRTLSWSQRFKVALGTARGLAYLHHECLEWVIHCDIKPENILLNRDFEPKIADFGLAKLSKRDGSDLNLSKMRGRWGTWLPNGH